MTVTNTKGAGAGDTLGFEFESPAADSIKNMGNQLITVLLEKGTITAADVQNIVPGLTECQAQMLADALSNDGAIDVEELQNMYGSENPEYLADLAVYIGDAPKEMNRIRYILQDVRAFDRCPGFFKPIGNGSSKHGLEGEVAWIDLMTRLWQPQKEEERDCWYTLEGPTKRETTQVSNALAELRRLQRDGKDVFPIVKQLLESAGWVELSTIANKIDLSGFTIQQAAEISSIIVGVLRTKDTFNMIFYLVPFLEIVQQVRCKNEDDFNASGYACFGINQMLVSLEDRIIESVRANLQEEGTGNAQLAKKTIELYEDITGRDISDKVK